jgi:hypothetical protein
MGGFFNITDFPTSFFEEDLYVYSQHAGENCNKRLEGKWV